jgi:hypothetical protein
MLVCKRVVRSLSLRLSWTRAIQLGSRLTSSYFDLKITKPLAIVEHDPPRTDGIALCQAIRRYAKDEHGLGYSPRG